MQQLPHRYYAAAVGEPTASITISSPDLQDLEVDGPPEFGGPGGYWSPETMLVAAVANCYILTWRSVAAYNKIEWTDMKVDAQGVLDRIDRVTRFTEIHMKVQVALPAGYEREKIDRLLERSKSACLITNSMTAEVFMEVEVTEV
jgi:peroxiredoxin-like protein